MTKILSLFWSTLDNNNDDIVMIEILKPTQFKTIPWKNGQGETTELAINEGGSLDDFDWRLSIASVCNDGLFSNFSGYQRNLVLIDGQGLSLQHDEKNTDILENLLDIASFDGACQTYGKLTLGAIKDFNIITKTTKIIPKILCHVGSQQVLVELLQNSICFGYSLTDEMVVEALDAHISVVPVGYLAKLSTQKNDKQAKALKIKFTGKNMIIVQLDMIKNGF